MTAPAEARVYRIGELAAELGVSTRTLRYYEELGLCRPSAYSQGGSRRYLDGDRDRILRIRELQSVMGFNLQEIHEILDAEDRLAALRTEYDKGVTPKRHRDILLEAARLNARTMGQVGDKIAVLEAYRSELLAKAEKMRGRAVELGVELPADTVPPARR